MAARSGRRTDCWFDDRRRRARFELDAQRAHPTLTSEVRSRPRALVYRVALDVPKFDEAREATIVFADIRTPRKPSVYVDGPARSPHRYSPDGALCMWHPRDPLEQRWTAADGLLALIDHTRRHLFQEAYWRKTSVWPGPELPHYGLFAA